LNAHIQICFSIIMKKLSVGQRKTIAEFFTNAAVAWLTIGVISPLFTGGKLLDFVVTSIWGFSFTMIFLLSSLYFTKGIKS